MTIAVSVRFEDHTAAIIELLERKLRAAVGAAAEGLADEYKFGLQRRIAPPHSRKGQVPYAYLGHKAGGFGPVNAPLEINNTVRQGFSQDQVDYLSSYIHGTASAEGQRVQGLVGFTDSHVTSRSQNYLLWHNRNGRPWVRPLYQKGRKRLAQAAKIAFEGTR